MAKNTEIKTKRTQIYYTIRNEISTGKYPGGTFLVESDLCEQFSVSRTPVREALIRLAQDDFVELIPNRGAVIPHVTLRDIANLCELRGANEGMAAYLLAKNHSAAVLQKLEESVHREEQLLQRGECEPTLVRTEDFAFHALLTNNCGNQPLINVLDKVNNQMQRFTYLSADNYAIQNSFCLSVAAHREAVEAIRSGDGERAQSVMIRHWMVALDGYFQRSAAGRLPISL